MNFTACAADAKAPSATDQMSTTTSTPVTMDANGVLKKTESTKFMGIKEEGAGLHIITMLAVGFVGTKLLMYKKWTLDMKIVAAASAAYIAAEIANMMNLKKQLKDMNVDITKSSDGKMDQAQITTLQKLKESYEAVKKSSKIKKMLQLAAAAAFGVAAATAGYQYFTENGKLESCMAAVSQGTSEVALCAARPPTDPEQPGCLAAQASFVALEVEIPKMSVEAAVPGPSEPKEVVAKTSEASVQAQMTKPETSAIATAAKANIKTACEAYYVAKNNNTAFGNILPAVAQTLNPLEKILYVSTVPIYMSIDPALNTRNFLQRMVDLVFPKAEASMMAMLGLGAGAAAAFTATKFGMTNTIDNYIFTPGARIILWGIFAGAAFMASRATQSEIDKLDAHIKKIDQMLKDLNTLQKGVTTANVEERQINLATFKPNQNQDISLNPNASIKTDCLANSGESNCTKIADNMTAIPGFNDLPDSFKSVATQSAQMGDGLSGKNSISGATLGTAESLGNKQAAIAKLGNTIKRKINDGLAKAGKPKKDFDKLEKALFSQMKAQTGSALQSGGMSPSGFLASTGLSSSPPVGNFADDKKKSDYGGEVLGSGGPKDKGPDFNLDLKDKAGTEDLALGSGAEGKESGAKFDIGTNDINTNSGDSLFQVISNRYIKSAYPKLFEEIPLKH
jgi:hypothetical protein